MKRSMAKKKQKEARKKRTEKKTQSLADLECLGQAAIPVPPIPSPATHPSNLLSSVGSLSLSFIATECVMQGIGTQSRYA